ncbi:hypothetical protein JCGZ_03775 [Jatropha curcas]|uniref:Aminotransferase-like plant mobile domain-containing protein n=1 Tax=Jatropha curcas TaxID=180498 RepID=A0A067JNK8_JATCU|nr:hypothetical protein JCGZ_03775 [Jatropha curcas]
MASLVTLRGLPIDWAFLDTYLHLWDLQDHVFQFFMHNEKMCPTYKEFATLLGSDSKRAPVAGLTGTRLIERYLDMLDFVDLEHQRFRTQALVFCLVSTCILTCSVGWGDLRVVDLVLQLERRIGIVSMALAKIILSLDRAYRVDGIWVPPARALFQEILISPRITMVILGSWSRGAHVLEAGVSGGRIAAYEAWWMAEHGER